MKKVANWQMKHKLKIERAASFKREREREREREGEI